MKNRIAELFQCFALKPERLLHVTLAGWILTKYLTRRLWLGERNFPLVPFFEALAAVPSKLHLVLLVCSLLLMLILLIQPHRRIVILMLMGVELFSCLLDQNRLQPWEYQFLFLLFIQLTVKPCDQKRVYLILLGGLYTYSGLHKLNPGFLEIVWKDMILNNYLHFDIAGSSNNLLYRAGYIIPLIELSAGCCLLLVERLRQLALSVLIVMHLIILIIIGPIGIRYNLAVWPWNLVMIFSLYMLKQDSAEYVFRLQKRTLPAAIVCLCWLVLPAFSFMGKWDQYLSANLYSGNLPRVSICISDSSKAGSMRRFFSKNPEQIQCKGKAGINVHYWSMWETGVPFYPELRVLRRVDDWWQKKFPESGGVMIYYPAKDLQAVKKISFAP